MKLQAFLGASMLTVAALSVAAPASAVRDSALLMGADNATGTQTVLIKIRPLRSPVRVVAVDMAVETMAVAMAAGMVPTTMATAIQADPAATSQLSQADPGATTPAMFWNIPSANPNQPETHRYPPI